MSEKQLQDNIVKNQVLLYHFHFTGYKFERKEHIDVDFGLESKFAIRRLTYFSSHFRSVQQCVVIIYMIYNQYHFNKCVLFSMLTLAG